MVASPTTCRATPQMGGGMKEEAAVGGLGNRHEEEGSEDEGEAVDLEKVRLDTTMFQHKCLYSIFQLCPYLRLLYASLCKTIPQGVICNLLPRQHHKDRSLPKL